MLASITLTEVAGTSLNPMDLPGAAQFTAFLAPKTAPVFEQEPTVEPHYFTEVVAVTYRNAEGKPIHGGLFGFSEQGVASLTLKDLAGKVDTSEDPAHVAFGLLMMRGPLRFRQKGLDQPMKLSIIDIHATKLEESMPASTPAREAVKKAYLTQVLPTAALPQ